MKGQDTLSIANYWDCSKMLNPGTQAQITRAEQPAMLFTPNLTGPLHIASAIVLWLTVKEAKLRGARTIVWLDDMPSIVDTPGNPIELRLRDDLTVASARKACELLGIDAYFSRRSRYNSRYIEVMLMLVEAGLFVETAPLVYNPIGSPKIADLIQSVCRDAYRELLLYCPSRGLCTAVDFYDFQTPLHIRGLDIHTEAPREFFWHKMVRLVLGDRPFVKYAHIPEIYRMDGAALHKSGAYEISKRNIKDDPFIFEEWAKRFSSRKDLTNALEQIVLEEGKEYSLANIRKEPVIRLDLGAKKLSAMPNIHTGTRYKAWRKKKEK